MNPVLRKDLFGLLRLRRAAWATIAFAAALCAIVLLTWPQGGILPLNNAGEDHLVLGLALAQLTAILLFVPGTGAVSLSMEVEAGTLEMMCSSRLSAREIITGKVLSVISIPLFLMLIALPFAGLLYYRGGTDPSQLVWVYAILLTTAGLWSIAALMISAFCRRSGDALAVTYLLLLLLVLGLLVPGAILLGQASGLEASVLHYARAASPIAALLAVLQPGTGDFDGNTHGLLSLAPVFVAVSASGAILCSTILVWKLRRPVDAHYEPAATSPPNRSRVRRLLFIVDPSTPRRPISTRNAIYALESRVNPLRSGRWNIRIFYGSLCVAFALALMSLYGGTDHPDLLNYVMQVLLAFHFSLIALLCPCLTSGSISSEVQQGTLELLRLAPLKAAEIFRGKLLSALKAGLTPMVAMLPAYAALCYLDPSYVPFLYRIVPILAGSVFFCCTVGLACSSMATNVSRATTAAYLIAIGFLLIPLIAQWMSLGRVSATQTAAIGLPSSLGIAMNIVSADPITRTAGEFWKSHLLLTAIMGIVSLAITRLRLGRLLRLGH